MEIKIFGCLGLHHVILFNLGGVYGKESLKPFLRNLFMDPAILRMPYFFRKVLSELIVLFRSSNSAYRFIDYHSPLLKETLSQQDALQALLPGCVVHVAMRCSKPDIEQAIKKIATQENVSQITLLPLYPHFSTTTTGSAFVAFDHFWKQYAKKNIPVRHILSFATHPLYLKALKELIMPIYREAQAFGDPLVVFSAHGLPKSIISQGDPYLLEIQSTIDRFKSCFDFVLGFQSCNSKRWTPPFVEQIIENETRPLVIVPISFVSEHVETCVELDILYKQKAKRTPFYGRVPTPGIHPIFMNCLADLVCQR